MGDNREVILTSLADSFIRNRDNRKYYTTFIEAIHESQFFRVKKAGPVHDVVAEINVSLNSSKNRLEGVCLLQELVSHCSTEVFTQNAITWLRMLTLALQSHDSALTMEMTCDVTAAILQHTTAFPELSREVASTIIPALVPALLQGKHDLVALRCLIACMTHYYGPCGPFKNKIEAHVVPLLDGNKKELAQVACQSFPLLALCGGGGNQGVKHAEAWSVLVQRLLGSISDTLTGLLHAVHMGLEDMPEPQQRLSLSPVPVTEPGRTCLLHGRYTTLVDALMNMLSVELSSSVRLPVDDILQVICRGLAVTPRQVMFHATQERMLLCAVLPLLQACNFRLLQALITSCRGHLVVYGNTINRLFIQTLNWSVTEESDQGSQKPYSGLRCEVYQTLLLWIQTVGASSGLEHVMTDLINHWVKDVRPAQDVVKLDSRLSQKTDALMMGGGKKKRRHGTPEVAPLGNQQKVDQCANQHLCKAALEVMRHAVLSIAPLLKAKHHQVIHSVVLPILMDVLQGTPGQQGAQLPPYTSSSCRAALYRLLLACVLCPHTGTPTPLHCAVRLFTLGVQDPDPEVSSTCIEAVAVTDVIRHPRAPVITVPEASRRDGEDSAQHAGVLGLHLYEHASTADGFAPGFSYPLAAKTQKTQGPAGIVLLNSERKQTEAHQAPVAQHSRRDIEVVSVPSSDSGDDKDSGADSDEENDEDGDEEEEEEEEVEENGDGETSDESGKENICDEDDIIAIEDDSNSPKPSSSIEVKSSRPQAKTQAADNSSDIKDCGQVATSGTTAGAAVVSTGATAGEKRKHEVEVEEMIEEKDMEVDQTEMMMAAFVDASPDSD